MSGGFQCAGCGEWNEIDIAPEAGTRQEYVEDCQVCCKPNILQIIWNGFAAEYKVMAELE